MRPITELYIYSSMSVSSVREVIRQRGRGKELIGRVDEGKMERDGGIERDRGEGVDGQSR